MHEHIPSAAPQGPTAASPDPLPPLGDFASLGDGAPRPDLVEPGDPYRRYQRSRLVRRYGFGALGVATAVTLAAFLIFAERPGPVHVSSVSEFERRGASGDGGPSVQRRSPAQSGGATWSEASGVGRLYVLTYPPGAVVWVDGDSVGVTPVPPHALRAGAHALSIRKEGFAPYDTVVFLASDETSFHHVELGAGGTRSARPTPAQRVGARGTEEDSGRGGIVVSSEPAGSEVWLEDERVGATPLTLSGLSRGWHRLSIRHAGYAPHVEEVEVEPGAMADLRVQLLEPEGVLTVLVRPWGSIYVDGQLHKLDTDAPYRVALAVGTHRVKALHPTLGILEQEVAVEAGGSERVVLDLSGEGGGAARPVVMPLPARPQLPPPGGPDSPPEVLDIAEKPPVLLGGLEGLHSRARYPERAYAFGVEGQVFLQFVVGEDGRVRDPHVVRGLGMGCDEEALRVIREARFTPGSVGGRPVAVRHALSIRFKKDNP